MVDYGEPKDRRAEIPDELWDAIKSAVEQQHPGFEMKILIAVDANSNSIDIESPSNRLGINSATRSTQTVTWRCKNGFWHYTQIVGGSMQEFKTTLKC